MRFILPLLAALLVSNAAFAATPDEDAARYAAIFSGETSRHNDSVEELAWMGISDPRVYDVIEQRVLREAQAARGDKDEKNRVARYIRALGFSGQPKYLQTIGKFSSDKVYERYANTALEDVTRYQIWNPVISNRSTFDPKYSDDVNRILNMLRSNDMRLKKIGAKRIYFAHRDDVLLETLAKELQANYQRRDDDDVVDSVAWLVKALGHSKNPKYRPLIQEVAGKAGDSKVVQYARKALEP
jgi:hypothetical protein